MLSIDIPQHVPLDTLESVFKTPATQFLLGTFKKVQIFLKFFQITGAHPSAHVGSSRNNTSQKLSAQLPSRKCNFEVFRKIPSKFSSGQIEVSLRSAILFFSAQELIKNKLLEFIKRDAR